MAIKEEHEGNNHLIQKIKKYLLFCIANPKLTNSLHGTNFKFTTIYSNISINRTFCKKSDKEREEERERLKRNTCISWGLL